MLAQGICHSPEDRFAYQTFAQGDNTDRRIRMFSRVKEDTVDYDWAAPWDYFTGRNVRLHPMANCPDDFSLCGVSGGSISMPFVTWDNSDRWFNWDAYGRESAGVGRDKTTAHLRQASGAPPPSEVPAAAEQYAHPRPTTAPVTGTDVARWHSCSMRAGNSTQ